MRKLLDNSTRRRLELLEYLNNASKWVSSNELAINLDASLRTINSDIQYLRENWHEYVTLETSKKNGIRLTTPPNSHIQLIYQEIIRNSDNFLLLEKMFFCPTKNLDDWENDLYSSYSSLYRTSQLIDEVMQKHGLELKKAPFHVSNKNEVSARYFFINYFNEIYFVRDWPFDIDRELVNSLSIDIAEEFFGVTYQEIDDLMLVYISYIIAVSLTRQSQGFWVDYKDFQPSLEKYLPVVVGKKGQLQTLAERLNLTYNEALIKDIALSIYLFRKDIISDKQWEHISTGIDEFIDQLEEVLHVHPSDNDRYLIRRTFKAIYLHHQTYPHREDVLFNRYTYSAKLIMDNYPGYSSYLKFGLKQLEEKTDFPWYTQYYDHMIYWLMIKWHNLAILIDQKKRKANVLVVNDHGKDHTLFLANLLQHNFANKAVITPYTGIMLSKESLKILNWDDYDVIVSNFYIPDIPEEKLVLVNSYPSNQEWAKIRYAINTAHQLALELLHSIFSLNDDPSESSGAISSTKESANG
ncbi:helix-turn-helix domain-containing protein [Vagococcus zengguangii]|uniref:HTH domain-containing protein n=1 Tax=Vagococcus zengguangii TaxID=2571750 RepID=A0A4D7CVB2_9ENTE|nr:helix-turn-helix domain-containing protein [Vagococcus zengguangii]QCI87132.1 HTH domain-containing protein [Vagococcus zengguangii]TLG80636.1 HTH domain-containing protein [Vagococcus zengguangii]